MATKKQVKTTESPQRTLDAGKRRRPRQQRALDRLEAIYQAAQASIIADGLENLSMVGIAARAGISSGSIYQYFGSIDEIMAQLLARDMGELGAHQQQRLNAATSPAELLDAVSDAMREAFKMYSERPELRAIWGPTRYLSKLREMDQEDTRRQADMVCKRLREIAPNADRSAFRIALLNIYSVLVPSFEVALSLPPRRRARCTADFRHMAHSHLESLLGIAP